MRHAFAEDPHDPHCQVCGASYHCPVCEEGCGMMGHLSTDAQGQFYNCADKPRYEAVQLRWRQEREAKERAELARLRAKYE